MLSRHKARKVRVEPSELAKAQMRCRGSKHRTPFGWRMGMRRNPATLRAVLLYAGNKACLHVGYPFPACFDFCLPSPFPAHSVNPLPDSRQIVFQTRKGPGVCRNSGEALCFDIPPIFFDRSLGSQQQRRSRFHWLGIFLPLGYHTPGSLRAKRWLDATPISCGPGGFWRSR